MYCTFVRKRATNSMALSPKITYENKASYGSLPQCIYRLSLYVARISSVYVCVCVIVFESVRVCVCMCMRVVLKMRGSSRTFRCFEEDIRIRRRKWRTPAFSAATHILVYTYIYTLSHCKTHCNTLQLLGASCAALLTEGDFCCFSRKRAL